MDHIYSFHDFHDRVLTNYHYNDNAGKTMSDAYDYTERQHIEKYGQRKYKNFESYRVTTYHYLKRKKR